MTGDKLAHTPSLPTTGILPAFIRRVDALNEAIGCCLSWSFLLMTIVTLLVVFLGSAFRVGYVWMSELVVYMHASLFTLAAAYTLLHDGHVRIDVFYARLSPKRQAWVNLCGVFLLLLPVCVAIFSYSLPYVAASWQVWEKSPEGQGLPAVFLLKSCLLLMPVLLALQGLSLAAKSYLQIRIVE